MPAVHSRIVHPPDRTHARRQALPARFRRAFRAQPLESGALHGLPALFLPRPALIARPPGFPFNLNSAVDALLKREFDRYRAQGAAHPLMTGGGLRAPEPSAVNGECEYCRYAAQWAGA